MKRLCILLLLSVSGFPSYAELLPSLRSAGPGDSLQTGLRQSKPDSNRVQLLLHLGAFYLSEEIIDTKIHINYKKEISSQRLDSALMLAQEAAGLGRRLRLPHKLDQALFLMGDVYIHQRVPGRVRALLPSLTDTSRIKLLLTWGRNTQQASDLHPARRDSALCFFQWAKQASDQAGLRHWQDESLFQLGAYYIEGNDLPRGKAYFLQAIEANQRAGNLAGAYRAWFKLGYALSQEVKYSKEALNAYERAMALANQTHNKNQQAHILYEIACVHWMQQKKAQAEREFLQARTILKTLGDQEIYAVDGTLITVYIYKGEYSRALYYGLEAVKGIKVSNKWISIDLLYYQLGNAYSQLSIAYSDSGYVAKAAEAFRQSLAISKQKGEFLTMSVIKGLVKTSIKLGKIQEALRAAQDISHQHLPLEPVDNMMLAESMGECYAALHQYKQAEKYYLQSIRWSKQTDPVIGIVAYGGIGRFYVHTKQYRKARPYLSALLAAPKGLVPPAVLQEFCLLQFQVDSAAGNYLAAIAHFRQHTALKDSLFNAAKSRQLQELQVQYETSQQAHRIQLLTAKGQRQQSELARAQLMRNTIMAGACLLLGLLGVSYNRYRLKQRSNRLLEAKQALLEAQQYAIHQQNQALERVLGEKEELLVDKDELLNEKEVLLEEKEWLLKETHHRVKNNLQIISSLLYTQSKYLHDPQALAAISQSRDRVQAIALMHQKLYQSAGLGRVDMPEYISEIVSYLVDSFNCQATVTPQLHIAALKVDLALATPLGLILNEAVTNVLKYAFPAAWPGTLTIALHPLEECSWYELCISDDGVGFTEGFNAAQSPTLGLSIIRGLSKQLDGRLSIVQAGGVQLRLQFPVATKTSRVATLVH